MTAAVADDVYRVLRRLANRQLQRGRRATLDTTALVHEAWIRLEAGGGEFESRGHFLAIAATAMRQILVDHARRRRARKRGGDMVVVADALSGASVTTDIDMLLSVHDALTKLEALDERLARVVEWRYFAGLEETEIASALEVDVRTVRRAFRKARAFILAELGETR